VVIHILDLFLVTILHKDNQQVCDICHSSLFKLNGLKPDMQSWYKKSTSTFLILLMSRSVHAVYE